MFWTAQKGCTRWLANLCFEHRPNDGLPIKVVKIGILLQVKREERN